MKEQNLSSCSQDPGDSNPIAAHVEQLHLAIIRPVLSLEGLAVSEKEWKSNLGFIHNQSFLVASPT